MAERPWHIDVTPVERDGSPGAATREPRGVTTAPAPELVRLVRRRPWDRLVALALAGSLALALLKPWAAAPVEPLAASATPAGAAALPTVPAAAPTDSVANPFPFGKGTIPLPTALFTPPASRCMQDVGWRVCVLGDADGQRARNTFAPNAPWLADPMTVRPTDPAVVLATETGAALAFYPPPGFYALDQGTLVATVGGDPDLFVVAAWGKIAVSAWRVNPAADSHWLDLRSVGPLAAGALVASNVFVPPDETLAHATSWPAGRYIVRLYGDGVAPWQQFFDVGVISDRGTNTP